MKQFCVFFLVCLAVMLCACVSEGREESPAQEAPVEEQSPAQDGGEGAEEPAQEVPAVSQETVSGQLQASGLTEEREKLKSQLLEAEQAVFDRLDLGDARWRMWLTEEEKAALPSLLQVDAWEPAEDLPPGGPELRPSLLRHGSGLGRRGSF